MVYVPQPGVTNNQRPWGIYFHTEEDLSQADHVTSGTIVYEGITERGGEKEFLFHMRAVGWAIGPRESLEMGFDMRNISSVQDLKIMNGGTWTSGIRVWCLQAEDQCELSGRDAEDPDIQDEFEIFFYGKPSINRPAPGSGMSKSPSKQIKHSSSFRLELAKWSGKCEAF